MSQSPSAPESRANLVFMLLSAAVFAYFGFGGSWAHELTNDTPPKTLFMVVLLKWTLRGGAIVFGIAAVLSLVHGFLGGILYTVAGLVTSVLFIIVGVWDMQSEFYSGISPVLLFIFAAWNGIGSWIELQDLLASRRAGVEPAFASDERPA